MTFLVLTSLAAFAGTLTQAREAREAGNYAGAASLLDALHPLIEPEEEASWQLERGLVAELQWQPELAEPYYRAAILSGGEAGVEARYHLVVVLDDMGRYDEAREALDQLRGLSVVAPSFHPILDVQAGVIDLHTGYVRRGTRGIQKSLAKVAESHPHPWMEGRGRYALLDAWSDAADALGFTGTEGLQKRNLKRRVQLLRSVESELLETIHTNEPEWITSALLRVGQAYSDLANDLSSASPPTGLSVEQAAIFRREVGLRAEAPRTKAYDCYDKGIEYALRVGFLSPTVEHMRQERDTLARLR